MQIPCALLLVQHTTCCLTFSARSKGLLASAEFISIIMMKKNKCSSSTLATWRTGSPRFLYFCTQCRTSWASDKRELFVNPAICEIIWKMLWRFSNQLLTKIQNKETWKKYLKGCSIVDYIMSSRGIKIFVQWHKHLLHVIRVVVLNDNYSLQFSCISLIKDKHE